MKTKLFLIIVLTILSSTIISSQIYFPLEVGNKWQYEVIEWDPTFQSPSTYIITIEVIKDTLTPNNIHYFILNGQFPLGEILRSDSIGVYYYDIFDSTDCLVYDFNSELNNPYKTNYQAGSETDAPIVTLTYIDSTNIFSQKVKFLAFSYNWMIGHNITLAENIGPIYMGTGGDGTTLHIDFHLIGYQNKEESFGSLTSVNNNRISIDDYKLYQNYPNPFNPVTVISYQFSVISHIELKVFDVLGNEIATLVNEEKAPGRYNIMFDAGKYNLSSGVYFYSLRAGEFTSTKKITSNEIRKA